MRLGKVLSGQQNVKVALLGRKVRKTSARLRSSTLPIFLTAAIRRATRRKERLCPSYEIFLFSFAKCLVRKSASTSTRAGRGPPGGVTRCTAPSACFQPF